MALSRRCTIPGPQFAAYGRQLAEVMQQRIYQCAAIAFVFSRAGSGVNHHAGRLVDYRQVGVFENDVQRNVFRHRAQRRAAPPSKDRDALTAAQTQRRLRGRIIHQHQILGDELLHPGPAGFGKLRDQKLVEPFAGIVRSRRNQKWN